MTYKIIATIVVLVVIAFALFVGRNNQAVETNSDASPTENPIEMPQ